SAPPTGSARPGPRPSPPAPSRTAAATERAGASGAPGPAPPGRPPSAPPPCPRLATPPKMVDLESPEPPPVMPLYFRAPSGRIGITWIDPPPRADIQLAVAAAELLPMGVKTDPIFDRGRLEPLVRRYNAMRRGGASAAELNQLARSIHVL